MSEFTPDIFRPLYPEILDTTFNRCRPNGGFNPMFFLLRTLYKADPGRFAIVAGLHQNTPEDALHLTIRVIGFTGNDNLTIHLNGYWRNGFKQTTITYVSNGSIIILADFRPPPPQGDASSTESK